MLVVLGPAPPAVDEDELIQLNIGGCSYRCRASTLYTRAPESKLARFAQSRHDARLLLCDAYFEVH